MKKKLRFVGNGMAGIRCLEEITKLKPNEFDVVVYGSEPYPNYNRIQLSAVLTGEADVASIILNDWDWYSDNGIVLRAGETVTEIDPQTRRLRTVSGLEDEYDVLVLATGSNPIMLPLPGVDKQGVVAFRNIRDCEQMLEAARSGQRAAVIGGGLLGLEAAHGLLHQGMAVTVVHLLDVLMESQLDQTAGDLLRKALAGQGVQFAMSRQTAAILGDERVACLQFVDGETLATDLVVMAVGIRPAVELAKGAGLAVDRGIVVNDYLQTSLDGIYAVGECAEHRRTVYGLVAPLFEQAQVLARHICGVATAPYVGSLVNTKLKVAGVDVFSAGRFLPHAGDQVISLYNEPAGVYKKLVCEGHTVVGAVLFGNTDDSGKIVQWMKESRQVDTDGVPLVEYRGGAGDAGDDVAAMDPAEIVCGCNGVTKGDIVRAVMEHGCKTIADVRDHTRATGSCGGCKGTVAKIIASLTDGEVAQEESLCGCTTLTRNELVASIRELHLTHTREAMNVLGWQQEGGCSKCRPALNYYLSMVWPEEHTDEKDSRHVNERLHANIQKDGTFSVVPRLYGGVITPEQLRMMADVAEKYEVPLVKVTGGQRIDLLGIQKAELPAVWADLGMPSGYAYGKSMRTVKTCVGNQFCRFGTQNSISLGIRLEQTFEHLNTPAKVKMAVNGCPRNCAEPMVKDIGIIGVEGAWEIFVGGNGGIHLRAAELLETVATDDEVLEWCGAVLQLYREEAAYLERTSVWVEKVGIANIKARLADPALRRELNARLEQALAVMKEPWCEVVTDSALQRRYDKPIVITRGAEVR